MTEKLEVLERKIKNLDSDTIANYMALKGRIERIEARLKYIEERLIRCP